MKNVFLIVGLIITASNLKSQVPSDAKERVKSYNHKCKYWCPKREFDYLALYIDSAGKTISKENILITATGKVWEIDVKQTLLTFHTNFTSEDSMRFALHPLNGKKADWFRVYQEGAIEDSLGIWTHPIRQNQYLLTELAPFPEIKFPFVKGKTWNSTLYIYEAFGSFKGTVVSTYEIIGKELRQYSFGNFPCWKIEAKGIHDKLGENKVTYYFHEEFGFTEMLYDFYNKQKITFKLVALP